MDSDVHLTVSVIGPFIFDVAVHISYLFSDIVRTALPQFSTMHFIHTLLFSIAALGIYSTASASALPDIPRAESGLCSAGPCVNLQCPSSYLCILGSCEFLC